MDYRPTGVCSQLIRVELDGDTIKNVEFIGGCNGNTKGISSLVKGMNVQDAISRMEGITCGYSSDLRTSIPLPCKSIFHFDKIILGSLHVTIGLSPTEILQDMLLLL